jgi:enterochelin esterase-like enzyme/sugar lactone lactonase YvrE
MSRTCFWIAALLAMTALARAMDDYKPGPDSFPHAGVPQGEVAKYTFDHSRIFPGTTRNYWIYIPRQYDPAKPACLYVGQDGVQFKAPVVFDNLIARHEMPVTIGVFIMHGRVKAESSDALDRFNRSYEYDGLGLNYARFLLEEILPEVERQHAADGRPIHLSTDPNDHAIGGASSGAICAFTAAWERPDAFRRVFSSIGTYVDQRGGNDYPALIRKTEAKPLRVFLQDGTSDLDRVGGHWHLANEEMLAALEFSGYEVNHIWGDGAHNGKQATAIFPDAMRWLWKDWPKAITCGVDSRQPVAKIILPEEPWKLAFQNGHAFNHLAADSQGAVFFYDLSDHSIRKLGLDGKVTEFIRHAGTVRGLAGGPDGRLYITGDRNISMYDGSGQSKIIAHNIDAQGLCVGPTGNIYLNDPAQQKIWLLTPDGKMSVAAEAAAFRGDLCLTPDKSLLLAHNPTEHFVHSFHILPDGRLAFGQPYFYLRQPDDAGESGAEGMAIDTKGTLFVPTASVSGRIGIQLCDQAGRGSGIILPPEGGVFSNVVFGGAGFDELFACNSHGLFRRKLAVTGAPSFRPPLKPAPPSL